MYMPRTPHMPARFFHLKTIAPKIRFLANLLRRSRNIGRINERIASGLRIARPGAAPKTVHNAGVIPRAGAAAD